MTRAVSLLALSGAVIFLVSCQTSEAPLPSPTRSQPATIEQPTAEIEPTPTPDPGLLVQGTDGFPWWNDTIFYEVFVRSFYDGDGDGVGDLAGLIEKLDYLNDGDPATTDDLGVTGIWLMPIMESPSYHGYDVVNYLEVDQEYGDNETFRRLMSEAHARGIRVIVDLVLNHTGRDHPWFVESSDPDSERRDWYVWSDQDPGFRGPAAQKVWHELDGSYYYALFWDGQPDLNYRNPDVTEAMFERARFWLEDMGVDGFRLDAIKHMVEDGRLQENTFATHEWLAGFFDFYKSVRPDAFTVGEAWTSIQQVLDYTGDEVDIAFQFDLAKGLIASARDGLASLVVGELKGIVETFPPGQYATFITNHDQNRAMSQFGGETDSAKVAASLLLTSPGVPFIYYGEEIGMMGTKPDEDIRRPMQWTADSPGAGFTSGTPWRPPFEDFETRNVAAQMADSDSLLNHYRALIHLRNEHAALRIGEWTLLASDPRRLIAFLRHSDDEAVLVLINPGRRAISDFTVSLPQGPLPATVGAELLLGDGSPAAPQVNGSGGFEAYAPLPELAPRSTHIILLAASN